MRSKLSAVLTKYKTLPFTSSRKKPPHAPSTIPIAPSIKARASGAPAPKMLLKSASKRKQAAPMGIRYCKGAKEQAIHAGSADMLILVACEVPVFLSLDCALDANIT